MIKDPIQHLQKNTLKTDGCWLWTGGASRGYGRFQAGGKKYLAHRLAYEIAHGSIEPGNIVCHTCDTPLCVNPSHLFQGTDGDNAADRTLKGRSIKTLSASDCALLKDYSKKPWFTSWWAAQRFGIDQRYVNRILRGESRAVI